MRWAMWHTPFQDRLGLRRELLMIDGASVSGQPAPVNTLLYGVLAVLGAHQTRLGRGHEDDDQLRLHGMQLVEEPLGAGVACRCVFNGCGVVVLDQRWLVRVFHDYGTADLAICTRHALEVGEARRSATGSKDSDDRGDGQGGSCGQI